jgi:glyoxylase-like metal-dependent hydrolase (beta-lactamase superfamily II)/8-oxo-dGTP pyrophosphatase MutT (NUDIX family)
MATRTRFAASIIVTRGRGAELEVLLAERQARLRFFGGFWAFPGGAVDRSDQDADGEPDATAFRRCALREVFEELALLAAPLDQGLDGEARERLRARLLRDEGLDEFRALVDRHPEALARVRPVGRLTTPEFQPVRFATEFLTIELPHGQPIDLDTGELAQARFMRARDAIDQWRRGEMLVAPPVSFLLELLERSPSFDAFLETARRETDRVEAGALHEIRFVPGITVAPLRTPTLPPATTTNCLLVGTGTVYVVDPATCEPAEQARLFDKMDAYRAAGRRFEAILLTHHHADHIGAVNAVSQRYRLPVHAHALTLERIPGGHLPGRTLKDGDRIDLGTSPDGRQDWHLDVIHTPGHDRGHLCFMDSRYGAAIVGDMLSTVSTIVIDPPEGHLRTYLRSLERLLAWPLAALHPAHGPPRRDGRALVREYLAHRRDREAALIEALRAGPATVERLVPAVYTDVPESVHGIATRSLLAGLEKLAEDGVAAQEGERWRLAV